MKVIEAGVWHEARPRPCCVRSTRIGSGCAENSGIAESFVENKGRIFRFKGSERKVHAVRSVRICVMFQGFLSIGNTAQTDSRDWIAGRLGLGPGWTSQE